MKTRTHARPPALNARAGGFGDELVPDARHVDPQAHTGVGGGVPGHVRAALPQRDRHRVRPGHDPHAGGHLVLGRGGVRGVLFKEEQEVGDRLRR